MRARSRAVQPPRGHVRGVATGSPADRAGVGPGWELVSVNGVAIPDILAYRRELGKGLATLALEGSEGQVAEFEVEWEDPGLDFDDVIFDGVRLCANKCEFCYVHQMPRGFRKSLYLMDDDFRTSFLYGSFVTLTNLTAEDIDRILDENLSPLYVSVHSADQGLRGEMMRPWRLKVKDPETLQIRSMIERLGPIDLYTQIVLVPGRNDGDSLDSTLGYLASRENVRAVAVVPVGLTEHRRNLPTLRTYYPAEARAVVERVERFQGRALGERGSRFAFLSDEFYLVAGFPVPGAGAYEGYPMLENGVGMVRDFLDDPLQPLLGQPFPKRHLGPRRILLATGSLFYSTLAAAVKPLRNMFGLDLEVRALDNITFGSVTTVAGLLAGRDLLAQIEPGEADLLLVSPNVLRYGTETLLDDVTLNDLRRALRMRVEVGGTTLGELGRMILWGESATTEPSFGYSTHALKEASRQH